MRYEAALFSSSVRFSGLFGGAGVAGGGRRGGGSGGRGTVDINLALKFICPGGLDHRNVTKREARNFEEFPG